MCVHSSFVNANQGDKHNSGITQALSVVKEESVINIHFFLHQIHVALKNKSGTYDDNISISM